MLVGHLWLRALRGWHALAGANLGFHADHRRADLVDQPGEVGQAHHQFLRGHGCVGLRPCLGR